MCTFGSVLVKLVVKLVVKLCRRAAAGALSCQYVHFCTSKASNLEASRAMTLPMKPELQAVRLPAALQRFVAEVHRRRLVELLLGGAREVCWCQR